MEKIKYIFGTLKIKIFSIQKNVEIGYGVRVRSDYIIRNCGHISIGNNFRTRSGFIMNVSNDASLKIGDDVFFNDSCFINARECISIGDRCIIGQNVMIYDHDHDYRMGDKEKYDHFTSAPVTIGKNVWIGSNVIVLKGANIGDNCVIGAGCIIRENIPEGTLVFQKQDKAMVSIDAVRRQMNDVE